jgi:hypothetical protein
MLPGEKTIEKAIKEMKKEGNVIKFGHLGELDLFELRKANLPELYPAGRHFTDLTLLLMRSRILSIMRKALEIEKIAKSDIADDARKYLLLEAVAIRYEALLILRRIDERLFNVKYAIYDVL